jgi:hypothetical protein
LTVLSTAAPRAPDATTIIARLEAADQSDWIALPSTGTASALSAARACTLGGMNVVILLLLLTAPFALLAVIIAFLIVVIGRRS